MAVNIREVDRVDILSLQDNYVDLVAGDGNEMVQRAIPLKGDNFRNSILAEHGFSALVSVTLGDKRRSMLFDFGFSENGAAANAKALGADLSLVEALALSHGHSDHIGGLEALLKAIGKQDLELVAHPSAQKKLRYLKVTEEFKIVIPSLDKDHATDLGLKIIETKEPYGMLDDSVLFLGEVPRRTEFETGMPNAFYEKDGVETPDELEDDTALVMNVKGKGLLILSGCAHAGIINTVNHARELTGVSQVHAVMGGFHLTGAANSDRIDPTVKAMTQIDPRYVIPVHCTGRRAVNAFEQEMPDKFILNMSGTNLVF